MEIIDNNMDRQTEATAFKCILIFCLCQSGLSDQLVNLIPWSQWKGLVENIVGFILEELFFRGVKKNQKDFSYWKIPSKYQ